MALATRSKVKVHKELNETFAKLLDICLDLNLKSVYENLEKSRSFMSSKIDRSELPEV